MKKFLSVCGSVWLGPIGSIVAGLAILVMRDPSPRRADASFDYLGALGPACLIFGILWLLLYATDQDGRKLSRSAVVPPERLAYEGADVSLLQAEVAARVKEAADFKVALQRKNEELRHLRASLNRADLKAVNEGVAAFLLAAEFLAKRIEAGKETPAQALPQLMGAVDELLEAAQLKKGLPQPGDRLAELPAQSCTVFAKLEAPTSGQKGQIVEVRNSWVGFMSGEQLVIVSPSRVSVYV